MTNRQRFGIFAGLVAIVWGIIVIATAVWAQDVDIPIDTVIRGAPGSVHNIAIIAADPGRECVAELTFDNDPGEEPSIHFGNDILVGPVTFSNVENGTFQAAGLAFTTTGLIDVAVRLGGDGVFSGGFTLEVTCNPPTTTTLPTPPITTPEESSTTSTAVPTTSSLTTSTVPSATTTTELPPIGGVPTGGGACADGACVGSLSPLTTWLLLGGALVVVSSPLAWAYLHYVAFPGDTE